MNNVYDVNSEHRKKSKELIEKITDLNKEIGELKINLYNHISYLDEAENAARSIFASLPDWDTYSFAISFPIKKELLIALAEAVGDEDSITKLNS